jgi:dTDP-4-amino-4,6-dideoxygalactose transaminase
LQRNGIATEIHYPVPPHRQKALAFLAGQNFPKSEEIHSTTLSLPISTFHSVSDIEGVVEVLNGF